MNALINGQSHALECDEAGMSWEKMPPPLCPTCGESLGAFCEDYNPRVADRSKWHNDLRVGCDGCDAEFPVVTR